MENRKTTPIFMTISKDSRLMLEKLSKIHHRSMTNTVEQLIREEAIEYGLIEARKKISEKKVDSRD